MIKICFDSSAIGKLVDSPLDDAKNTLAMIRLMERINAERERFELVVTLEFLDELNAAPKKVIQDTIKILESFCFVEIQENPNAETLANLYLEKKVLPSKSYSDLRHIAYASLAGADYVVSCDKHFLHEKTNRMISAINAEQGISVPKLVSPLTLLKQW
ncbi:hypothetical protein FACS1894170_07080 [Planctomycetales bacterium]|nr:hypothetical protein FACS1894170_07080 [Planctomycetales bacterium]